MIMSKRNLNNSERKRGIGENNLCQTNKNDLIVAQNLRVASRAQVKETDVFLLIEAQK